MDRESRTFAGGRIEVDTTALRVDDAIADREAQASPLADRLGGEEGVEDLVADGRFDAAALVDDVDLDPVGQGPAPDRHQAPGRAGIDGVGDQVEHHLVDLGGITGDQRQGVEVHLECHLLLDGQGPHDLDRAGNPGVQVDLLELALVDPGKVAESPDDLLDPFQPIARLRHDPAQMVEHVGQVDLLGELGNPREQLVPVFRQGPIAFLVEGSLCSAGGRPRRWRMATGCW